MPERRSILQKPVTSVVAPTPANPPAYWRVNDFEGLIGSQGYDALIDRAMRCPCVDKTSGQALSTCKNCLGRGWFFVDRTESRIIAQHMDSKRRYQDWGEINRGTASITTKGVDKLGFMDRIILTDLEEYFSEIIRPIMYRDLVAYPVYEPLKIQRIYLFVADDKPLYPIPENLYQVDGNRIVFDKSLAEHTEVTSMDKVPMTISIRYSHYPVYHVVDVNRELMKVRERDCSYSDEQLTQMPINVLARKAHYIFNAQNFDAEIFENSILDK